jgi:hypothetical protein
MKVGARHLPNGFQKVRGRAPCPAMKSQGFVNPFSLRPGGMLWHSGAEAEIEVMLKELGLPLGLIEHMQVAPAPLDPGESDDPYGLKVQCHRMTPESDSANGTGN